MSRSSSKAAILVLALVLVFLAVPRRAVALEAFFCTDCSCEIAADADLEEYYTEEMAVTDAHIAIEFASTELWLVYLFHAFILPAMQGMAEQTTTTAMMQTFIFGTFLDAQQQMEVQRTLQELTARAHKDYQPSDDLCMFGTVTRSLGATMFRGEANGYAMSEFGMARQLGGAATESSEGELSDRIGRLQQLRQRYCTNSDDNNNLGGLCSGTTTASTENRDVDYSGVLERASTLNADAISHATAESDPTDDEQDLSALANNLYGHDVPWRIPEWTFNSPTAQQAVLEVRSIAAQRAVASASFYTIAGMKSMGTPAADSQGSSADTAGYMNVIMHQLGVPIDSSDPDSALFLGARPSYDAQMEFLTKRIFEDSRFYSNLYDTPANVERKRVAMQAIGLIQDFDTLQSSLRTEMILSQTLELDLIKLQNQVVNELSNVSGEASRL